MLPPQGVNYGGKFHMPLDLEELNKTIFERQQRLSDKSAPIAIPKPSSVSPKSPTGASLPAVPRQKMPPREQTRLEPKTLPKGPGEPGGKGRTSVPDWEDRDSGKQAPKSSESSPKDTDTFSSQSLSPSSSPPAQKRPLPTVPVSPPLSPPAQKRLLPTVPSSPPSSPPAPKRPPPPPPAPSLFSPSSPLAGSPPPRPPRPPSKGSQDQESLEMQGLLRSSELESDSSSIGSPPAVRRALPQLPKRQAQVFSDSTRNELLSMVDREELAELESDKDAEEFEALLPPTSPTITEEEAAQLHRELSSVFGEPTIGKKGPVRRPADAESVLRDRHMTLVDIEGLKASDRSAYLESNPDEVFKTAEGLLKGITIFEKLATAPPPADVNLQRKNTGIRAFGQKQTVEKAAITKADYQGDKEAARKCLVEVLKDTGLGNLPEGQLDDKLRKFTPEMRIALKKELFPLIGDLKKQLNALGQASSPIKIKLSERIAELEEVQGKLNQIAKENGNVHLIQVITGEAKPIGEYSVDDMRQALILSGDSVIAPNVLFIQVSQALQNTNANDDKSKLTRQKLIDFTIEWCQRNYGIPGFGAGVKVIKESVLPHVLEVESNRLLINSMNRPPPPRPQIKLQPGTVGFEDLINQIADGKVDTRTYNQSVVNLAKDMYRIQGSFYCALTPDTLFKKKWAIKGVESAASPQEKAYAANFNKMSNYLIHFLISRESIEERAEMIKFLVDVANEAIKNGDFFTAYIIVKGTLESDDVKKMSWALERATRSSSTSRKLRKLTLIFDAKGNNTSYKKQVKKVGAANVMPYQGIGASELTMLFMGNPPVSPDTETYNFRTLLLPGMSIINNVLAGKPKVEAALMQDASLHTDLFSALQKYNNIDENIFHETIQRWRDEGIEKPKEK